MGGKTYHAIWGGGETYYRVCPPKPVLEGSESVFGLVCGDSVHVPSNQNDRA